MEEYDGLRSSRPTLPDNLDEAFMRRLAFYIQFRFPDRASRSVFGLIVRVEVGEIALTSWNSGTPWNSRLEYVDGKLQGWREFD
jgi:hypothetical protein